MLLPSASQQRIGSTANNDAKIGPFAVTGSSNIDARWVGPCGFIWSPTLYGLHFFFIMKLLSDGEVPWSNLSVPFTDSY